MNNSQPWKQEVVRIVLAASAGDETEAQLTRLSELILSDPAISEFVVELVSQEAWLSWHSVQVGTESLAAEAFAPRLPSPAGSDQARDESHDCEKPLRPETMSTRSWSERRLYSLPRFGKRIRSSLKAAVLLGLGALAGGATVSWVRLGLPGLHRSEPTVVQGDVDRPTGTRYVARFVQGTACVWEPGRTPLHLAGGGLRSGEAIKLMEGLAEIELNLTEAGHATLQIEGPAQMVLTAEGTPSLTLGKFSAEVDAGMADVALETPFGRVQVANGSSLGVAVNGLECEVHVFRGQVTLLTPWTSDGQDIDRFQLAAGESLRLTVAESLAMTARRGVAQPGNFVSQSSMIADRLEVSDAYASAVIAAAPVVYWRFQEVQDGAIPNEMGGQFQGVVFGAPQLPLQGDNRVIEFGAGLTDEALRAYVESSDDLGQVITDSYSVELWIKPSHYHLGSLVSFVRNPSATGNPGLHGMLLELGGPLTAPSTIEHPGRIRFLHRHPVSDDANLGTSCFSKSPYELRRWEYVVAVKDGPEMRLYVNGEQVAASAGNTQLSGNLKILIGQLDWHRDWRRFVGQLDELAIYSRALSDGEIQQHFQLVRPVRPNPDAI